MLADDVLAWVTAEDELYARERAAGSIPALMGPNPANADVSASLQRAVRYSFDEVATVAAHQVTYTRPSSMLQALPLMRLPAPELWIEWPEAPREQARQSNPKRHYRFDESVTPSRNGLLFREIPGTTGFAIRCLYASELDAKKAVNIGFGHMIFNPDRVLAPDEHRQMKAGAIPQSVAHAGGPAELDAYVALCGKFHYQIPEDVTNWIALSSAYRFMAHDNINEMLTKDMQDIGPEMIFSLACLLLLNSRNALDYRDVDLGKLNKARRKSGKPDLLGYKNTRLTLGRLTRARMNAAAAAGGGVISHWQSGHFKVRKSGIFWWHGHMRGDATLGLKPARYAVSA